MLYDATILKHEDVIGMLHRPQPVSDDKGCAPLLHVLESLLHPSFRFGIDTGCRLIQKQKF